MLTVACVLKSGGIYDATWVERLRDGVARHLHTPYRFVCLSDVDVPCDRIPLEHNWPGWWSKIELFKLRGPVLFFDLDTVIVGDLSDIAMRTLPLGGLAILEDFYRSDGCGSGVMSWDSISGSMDVRRFYKMFSNDPDGWMMRIGDRGDQGFIEEQEQRSMIHWQQKLPGQIVSYKVHCRNGIPPNARVICLHGLPKFGDMPVNDPVRQAWEMAA